MVPSRLADFILYIENTNHKIIVTVLMHVTTFRFGHSWFRTAFTDQTSPVFNEFINSHRDQFHRNEFGFRLGHKHLQKDTTAEDAFPYTGRDQGRTTQAKLSRRLNRQCAASGQDGVTAWTSWTS